MSNPAQKLLIFRIITPAISSIPRCTNAARGRCGSSAALHLAAARNAVLTMSHCEKCRLWAFLTLSVK